MIYVDLDLLLLPHPLLFCPAHTDVAAMQSSSEADWDSPSSSGGSSSGSDSGSSTTVRVKVAPGGGSSLRRLLNASKETLIAEEKGLLRKVVDLLEEVSPQVGEYVAGLLHMRS